MKKSALFFAVALCCCFFASGQTETKSIKNDEVIFKVVDKMPEFPGGKEALNDSIKARLHYPEAAVKKKIEGTTVVQFAVMADGTVDKVTVYVSAHPLLDEEAVRVVKSLPKWIPGKKNGKEVNSYYILPVVFLLGEK